MKFLPLLFCCCSLYTLAALGQTEAARTPRETGQDDGSSLIPEGIPERVVSLGPNITEMIFALGKGDLLVGRTDYCDYPAGVTDIPSVGSLTDPSLETILLLQPDLVIGSTHMKRETADKIEEMGIPVLNLYAEESFDGIYSLIATLAEALDAAVEGNVLIGEMRKQVRDVTTAVKDLPRPRVYYVIGYGEYGDYTAGGNTFIGQLLNLAGADNIASDLEGWRFGMEELIDRNPDMLICSSHGNTREELMNTPGYRELPAVGAGRVYTIDNNMLDRQGPRLAEGLAELAQIVHGNALP